MRSRLAMSLVCGGALAACSTVPDAATDELDVLGERLARTICPGPPTRVEPVPNRHVPGQMDRLETRECASGSATLYVGETTSDPDGLALAVEIRAASAGLPAYMEIGQPIERALRRLGEPRSRSAEAVTYGLAFDNENSITLHVANGRIASVSWSWLFD